MITDITTTAGLTLKSLSVSGECAATLALQAVMPVAGIPIPVAFGAIDLGAGVEAAWDAPGLTVSLTARCRIGIEATTFSSTPIRSCDNIHASAPTFDPKPQGSITAKVFIRPRLGLGLYKTLNLQAVLEASVGIEGVGDLNATPPAYLDAFIDAQLQGQATLGPWTPTWVWANERLWSTRIWNRIAPPPTGDAIQVTAGTWHTCALLTNGTAKCWGSNSDGQLGDGTPTYRVTPVPVTVSGLTGATAIVAGFWHTCALLTNGTAKCWGDNRDGSLGDGTTTERLTPVTVTGLSGATAIAAGAGHTCALLTNGTAKCWGANDSGELGEGTTTDRHTPMTVTGLTGATQLTAGTGHTCALLTNGTAKCWGWNDWGQLGDGTTTDRVTPVAVTGLTAAVRLTAGADHTCALLTNGTAKCWGLNFDGQLGDGTTSDRFIPAAVTGLADATAITARGRHTCALLTNGIARCWGANDSGQLGDGTTTARVTPVSVTGLANATTITAGGHHTCALLVGGAARCWGWNYFGQLGDGTPTDRTSPVTVTGL